MRSIRSYAASPSIDEKDEVFEECLELALSLPLEDVSEYLEAFGIPVNAPLGGLLDRAKILGSIEQVLRCGEASTKPQSTIAFGGGQQSRYERLTHPNSNGIGGSRMHSQLMKIRTKQQELG